MKPIIALIAALLLFPSVAKAEDVYTMRNVNLRAGPDGGYPVVTTLKRNERLELRGCVGTLQWCEVETRRGDYGWVYAPYLRTRSGNNSVTIIQSYNSGNTHIVIFKPRSYWDRHYKNRDFYKQRKKWIRDDDWNNYRHDRDDDNNDHGRSGQDRDYDDDRTVVTPPQKYQPMEMPSSNKGKYDPLCPMGVSDC